MRDLRRGTDRAWTDGPWGRSWHSLSFGDHYDPDDVSFGPVLAHNEEHVLPGRGFQEHPHTGLDLVSWVVSGTLRHEDGSGRVETLGPGALQVLWAGSGVRHSEVNPSAEQPLRYVQVWLRPDDGAPAEPSYGQLDATPLLEPGTLAAVACGAGLRAAYGDGPLPLRAAGVALSVARLRPGDVVEVPAADLAHVFVTRGTVTAGEAGRLGAGDALRVVGPERLLAVAGAGTTGSEVLVWHLPTTR